MSESAAASAAPGSGPASWCESCSRLVEADDATTDSEGGLHCPTCGAELVPTGDDDEGPPKAPWHFKVLLIGTIGYLIYRLIWFIGWLQHHH